MEKHRIKSYKYFYIAWVTALLATLASIYFIEIVGRPAAPLCWIERTMMLALFLVFTVGIYRKDPGVKYYAYPFLLVGIPSATYQQLVHWDIIKLAPQPCAVGFVCTTKFFELFGFITQATLCLTALLIIAFCASRIKPAGR